MSKLTKSFSTNVTFVPNHIINDNRLSTKSKGLFLYLCSKPENWSFSVDRIILDHSDGKASIISGLKELEKFSLLSRVPKREHGVFKGYDYILFDVVIPFTENRQTVKPITDFPQTVIPSTENNVTLNNKEIVILNEERENIYPFIDLFLDEASKSSRIRSPLAYRSKLREALFNRSSRSHQKTLSAYNDFVASYRRPLPEGIDIFDLYEEL